MPRQSLGVKYGVYAAHFTHGDRHAYARDDTLLSPIVGYADTSPEGGSEVGFGKSKIEICAERQSRSAHILAHKYTNEKLNVETEKHHVAVFHNVVLALGTDFAEFLGFYVTAAV